MSEWFLFTANDYSFASHYVSMSQRYNYHSDEKRPQRTALYSAAEHGKLTKVCLLLALGKNPDHADTYGITPVQIAAWNNHCRVVQKLVKSGCDVNSADRLGHTALFKSIWRNCSACVQLLLKSGADCNKQDDCGTTPLMLAAEFGFMESLLNLLAHGADPNKQNRWGATALHVAASRYDVTCVQHLLDFGADPKLTSYPGCTPLFLAVKTDLSSSVYPLLRALIIANTDLDKKGSDSSFPGGTMHITALESCLQLHLFPVAELLILAGCDTNCLLESPYGRGPRPCLQELQRYPLWLNYFKSLAGFPRRLSELCRNAIRKSWREQNSMPLSETDLQLMGLPSSLAQYVCLSTLPVSKADFFLSRLERHPPD